MPTKPQFLKETCILSSISIYEFSISKDFGWFAENSSGFRTPKVIKRVGLVAESNSQDFLET